MVINKQIKRQIFKNKFQYLGLILIILLSAFCFTLFELLGNNFENVINDYSKNYVQEDLSFNSNKKIENLQKIEKEFNLKIEENNSFDYSFENKTLRLFNYNKKVNLPAVFNNYNLVNDNDILVDKQFFDSNNYKIDQKIIIENKEFLIKGTVSG